MVGLTEASCIDARQETKLCWMKEDCIEMSWNVESIFYMHGRYFHKQSIFGYCFAWLYWSWYAIQFLMEMMTGIFPPSRSTQGLAFSPCPRMNARMDSSKRRRRRRSHSYITCFLRQVLILPHGFLLSDDPVLVEKNSCLVTSNANIMSKERKIRCVLTDEWEWEWEWGSGSGSGSGTYWTRTCMPWLWWSGTLVTSDFFSLLFNFLKKQNYYYLIFYIILIYWH